MVKSNQRDGYREVVAQVTESGVVHIPCPRTRCAAKGRVHIRGPVVVGQTYQMPCGMRVLVDGLEPWTRGRPANSEPITPPRVPAAAPRSTARQKDTTTTHAPRLLARRRAGKPGHGVTPDWLQPHLGELGSMNPLPAVKPCLVPDCPRDSRIAGLCPSHYGLARRRWDPTYIKPNRAKKTKKGH